MKLEYTGPYYAVLAITLHFRKVIDDFCIQWCPKGIRDFGGGGGGVVIDGCHCTVSSLEGVNSTVCKVSSEVRFHSIQKIPHFRPDRVVGAICER